MHLNVHYAFGIIVASITSYFLPNTTIFEFLIIICGSFLVDFDFLLIRFMKENNHRRYFTHTIYPSLVIILIAILINNMVIMIAGFCYVCHILLDLLDWGVRLFYTDKNYGLFLLLSSDERKLNSDDLKKFIIDQEKENEYFFETRYYNNKIISSIDIVISILGFFLLFTFKSNYWFVFFGFIIALGYHMFYKKKAEDAINSRSTLTTANSTTKMKTKI